MKKLVVALIALALTLNVVGCKDKGEGGNKAPACDMICEHVLKIMAESDSDEEMKMTEAEREEFKQDCAEDCGKQFDNEARKCVMASKTQDELKKCEKGSRKRRSAGGATQP